MKKILIPLIFICLLTSVVGHAIHKHETKIITKYELKERIFMRLHSIRDKHLKNNKIVQYYEYQDRFYKVELEPKRKNGFSLDLYQPIEGKSNYTLSTISKYDHEFSQQRLYKCSYIRYDFSEINCSKNPVYLDDGAYYLMQDLI